MRKTKLYQSCHASRPRSCHRSHRRRGITSACAEQTNGSTTDAPRRRDHLRVCGADARTVMSPEDMLGSPPRVRSRHGLPVSGACPPRITSACAEQTYPRPAPQIIRRDHLRVCGADIVAMPANGLLMGSPPRVRSRHRHGGRYAGGRGITSACAEQTRWATMIGSHAGDHLRVCGADDIAAIVHASTGGSPDDARMVAHFG